MYYVLYCMYMTNKKTLTFCYPVRTILGNSTISQQDSELFLCNVYRYVYTYNSPTYKTKSIFGPWEPYYTTDSFT